MNKLQVLLICLMFALSGSLMAQTQMAWRFEKGDHRCLARNPQEKPLFEAVINRNAILAQKLIQKGGDPNMTDNCGAALIFYAANMIQLDLFKVLVKAGVDVNAVDNFQFDPKPPLMWLIERADNYEPDDKTQDEIYDSVKFLIDSGADVNLRGESSDSALMLAVKNRNLRLVELLIASGAAINYQAGDDETAYGYAAQSGDKVLKQILIKAGADPTIGVEWYRKKYGENAFFQASADGRTDVVEAMLAAGTNVNSSSEAGKMTALMRASLVSTIDSLIAAGADLNLKDKSGHTALMWAVLYRQPGIVQKLIAAGADVNARNEKGESALDLVSNDEIRELLIKKGAK